ncbi:DoxX family protein [Hymenobacter sp. HSC-4F20]|uniref:DoxX family protein n=1 Tax=Hymenobacter sp. HSC-4F20 TaxID=2864135 RepID=UPI001C7393A0|nr:DoxX family protein [Hymenobacter sp. HSC-4F20]MBX0290525.1 DoxX family protein [Hymenobacter sp. HSC-4F20]
MTSSQPARWLHVSLWLVQALLSLLFIGTGIFKLFTPISTLATMWPWAGEQPGLVPVTAVADLLGGLGLAGPALARMRPQQLTRLAALGCALLQLCAIAFHFARGEQANTPFNFVLLVLAVFVWWGRGKAPIGTTT